MYNRSATMWQAGDREIRIQNGRPLIIVTVLRTGHANIRIPIVWLAKKEDHDPLVQEMQEIVRQKTIQQLLQEAWKAASCRNIS
jgi:hypothetical protein